MKIAINKYRYASAGVPKSDAVTAVFSGVFSATGDRQVTEIKIAIIDFKAAHHLMRKLFVL